MVGEAQLGGRQGGRLWTYLVLNRSRPLGREELATMLWDDEPPDAWDSDLSVLASRLRTGLRPIADLEPGLRVARGAGRYQLEVPPETFVDHERARAALHEAEVATRNGDHATAWIESRIAFEIARRGFLPGDEAPWITGQRRLLADVAHRALELLSSADLERGRPDDAAVEARQLVELDPLRESAYRILMRALGAKGDPAEAVRVMEQCRRTLGQLARLVPSPETERVFREVTAAGGTAAHPRI